jgi:DNA-binding NarL/FixJ family response regulator
VAPLALLLSETDDLIAHGLRSLLAEDDLVEVLASDVPIEALAAAMNEIEPDVVILDRRRLRTPVEVNHLAAAQPETALVVLVDRASAAEAGQLISFGATAVLTKDASKEDLLSAIRMAARGMRVIPGFRGGIEQEQLYPDLLTPREAEVLDLLQRGRSNAQIAHELSLGIETVRTHVRNILRKLGVSSRKQLGAFGPLS